MATVQFPTLKIFLTDLCRTLDTGGLGVQPSLPLTFYNAESIQMSTIF